MYSDSTKPLYKGVQIVWYGLYIIESLLVARFLLMLLSANPNAAFTNIIYTLSGIFTWPFATVFANNAMAGSVFEWTTLLAMLVYWLVAVAIVKLLVMSKSVSVIEADQKLSEEEV